MYKKKDITVNFVAFVFKPLGQGGDMEKTKKNIEEKPVEKPEEKKEEIYPSEESTVCSPYFSEGCLEVETGEEKPK